MQDELWLVVGDRFWQFAVDRKAITVSYLRGLLNSVRGDDLLPGKRMVLMLGQGVSDEDIAELLAMATKAPHAHRFDFSRWQQSKRASSYVSHKLRMENILLSEARRVDENSFEMTLMLDDHCELMIDHQSGRHLAGVVLIEAVRQSLLVVTEGHYLRRDGKKHDFTFHDLSVKFHRYCFPFETTLQYTVREMETRGNRYRFEVEVLIKQCDAVVASATAKMTAYVSPMLSKVESEQASRSLELYLASLPEMSLSEPDKLEMTGNHELVAMEA